MRKKILMMIILSVFMTGCSNNKTSTMENIPTYSFDSIEEDDYDKEEDEDIYKSNYALNNDVITLNDNFTLSIGGSDIIINGKRLSGMRKINIPKGYEFYNNRFAVSYRDSDIPVDTDSEMLDEKTNHRLKNDNIRYYTNREKIMIGNKPGLIITKIRRDDPAYKEIYVLQNVGRKNYLEYTISNNDNSYTPKEMANMFGVF